MALESQVQGKGGEQHYTTKGIRIQLIHAWHTVSRSLDALTADPAATLTSPVTI